VLHALLVLLLLLPATVATVATGCSSHLPARTLCLLRCLPVPAEVVAPQLEALKLVGTEAGRTTSAFLSGSSSLRELQLDFWGRSNRLPRAMADCAALTKLTIQCSSGLEGHAVLASLQSLQVSRRARRATAPVKSSSLETCCCCWVCLGALQPHLPCAHCPTGARLLLPAACRTCLSSTATGSACPRSCCACPSPACTCAMQTLLMQRVSCACTCSVPAAAFLRTCVCMRVCMLRCCWR
jgi:hypothetical protein